MQDLRCGESVLDMYVFRMLKKVREQPKNWIREYNEERPHESLGNLTSREHLLTKHPEIPTQHWY